ncbi:MAG TPA: 3-methyladenine DNA glycosylase [Candidatus Corynebacterium gallistercoris]|uniref:3-methyladenine DNA glycosylase n=1 Tax=Candidatus Corynebacterium gallistercoris TaxID=2838530 RepID=A0A9D1UQC7_9CORY|nr:3-methyladenine DNA glycosylase [Candidatus Corynebacterium gallistercoris]
MTSGFGTHTVTTVLGVEEWEARRRRHQKQADDLTADHVQRRARGERHPVWDFMFNYYPTTAGQLRRWHPGAGVGVVVEGDATPRLPAFKDHYGEVRIDGQRVWALDVERHLAARGKTVEYIQRLLRATAERPAQLGCFGLHEWAMVYRDTPRHPEPLRLGTEGTNEVVEANQLKCTHFDAFRFFTPQAAPRNELAPTRNTQPDLEQPGCLHASMDLYKWATKLGPLIPGELWLDTFRLACDVRRLDMEASPYDLREWGFQPVRIETPAGRAEYVRRQRRLFERAQELRWRILEIVDQLDSL